MRAEKPERRFKELQNQRAAFSVRSYDHKPPEQTGKAVPATNVDLGLLAYLENVFGHLKRLVRHEARCGLLQDGRQLGRGWGFVLRV
jgi:hypothetical protein